MQPFDRVRASLSRARSESPSSPTAAQQQTPSPSQHKKRPLSRIFSSSPRNSASFDRPSTPDPSTAIDAQQRTTPSRTSALPLNPHTSPETNRDALARSSEPFSPSHSASHANRLQFDRTLADDTSHVYTDLSAFDERDMKRRLMDMESSFVPGLSSPHQTTAQDSHAVGNASSPDHVPTHSHSASLATADNSGGAARPLHFHRPLAYIRAADGKAQSESGQPDDQVSPALDAADTVNQTHLARPRSSSALSGAPLQNRNSLPPQLEGGVLRMDGIIAQNDADAIGKQDWAVDRPSDAVGESASSPTGPQNGEKTTLKPHHASQRSSGSSILSFGAGSDLSFGGSGGMTPGSFSTVKAGNQLSRLPSLGSIASSMSVTTERKRNSSGPMNVAQETNLEPLNEESSRAPSVPETPSGQKDSLADPNQTVLAQHVKNVQVPTTVAKRFRGANLMDTTGKSSSPLFGRVKNELTLKEQNSRIDKLSKENFDLKLKIHYLHQALENRSDEGVKDILTKNAQLQAEAVKARKDLSSLKKRNRELEQALREGGSSTHRTTTGDESEDATSSRSFQQAHLEDEIIYLRTRMQALEEDNEQLRLGEATQRLDDRHLAERLKSLDILSNHDEADGLRAQLVEEREARERADHRLEQLHIELSRMQGNRSPVRNMFMTSQASHQDFSSMSGSTLVDQLRTENSNLRRDLGAQTSMLSSRNRERERLQQEIEDLKLLQRRGELLQASGTSVSGDSILDRSVSRSNVRPTSNDGAFSGHMSDEERDEFENREARLRDENAALRMRNQDLQKDLDSISYGGEHLASLRDERDEAMRVLEEERDVAAETVDRLESLIVQKNEEIDRLGDEIASYEDENHALSVEIREIGSSLNKVLDGGEDRDATIQALQEELTLSTGEIESLEQSLKDVQAAKERLEVQAESSQSEIAFLRDEQETDKIKISDLQSALSRAKASLRGEKEKLRSLEELETEAAHAREEARQLGRQLEAKHEEATAHGTRLNELEAGLKQILGGSPPGRGGVVSQVRRVQRDLDNALRELNRSKAAMGEKDRQLDETRSLINSHTTEAEQLHNLIDKERQARRHDRAELDKMRQRGTEIVRVSELEKALQREQKTVATLETDSRFHLRERSKLMYNVWTRVASMCGSDWLSTYAEQQGQEPPTYDSVTADPSSIDEPLSLALDTLSQNLAAFRMRIRTTEKELFDGLEGLSFNLDERSKRIEAIEKVVSSRMRSSGHKPAVPSQEAARSLEVLKEENQMLKDESKILKRELKMVRQANFSLPGLKTPQAELDRTEAAVAKLEREREHLFSRQSQHGGRHLGASPSSSHPGSVSGDAHGPARGEREASALTLHQSSMGPPSITDTAPESMTAGSNNYAESQHGGASSSHASLLPADQRWVLRLKEADRRLLAEREGRVLDREGARERIKQWKAENHNLRQELDRERERNRLLRPHRDARDPGFEQQARLARKSRSFQDHEAEQDRASNVTGSAGTGQWQDARERS